ncbi:UL16-binding protein 3-like isoform X3 [Ovis aries]|uniref:UL16-binding protein 3-like isoform X3 n=1 Tax=Ovis aries TaxID=9940 RepID=UPI00100E121E|nr:UL16-binding protein 3-like isoform X3 [Ovis aries]
MGDSKSSLGFLLLLLIVLFSGTSSDAHSLSYNFTIDPQPRDDQPWCEVQGEVDQKVFLSYDCGTAKIKYMSPLGEEVKNMSAWEAQTVTLRDTGDLLQGQMPDVTPEKHTDKVGSGLVTLQARMTCWREDDGHTNASWGFGFNGQLCLLFDSENGHWTVVHPGGRQMKEKWENDRTVTDFFRTVSMGDCWAWLQAFLVHWEKMLKSLAPPTTVPTTVQPTAATNNHITEIIFVVLPVFVITSIVACILYKKRRWSSQEVWQVCCRPVGSVSAQPPLPSCVHFRGKRRDPGIRSLPSCYDDKVDSIGPCVHCNHVRPATSAEQEDAKKNEKRVCTRSTP